jgi:hypothetical protein
MVSRAQRGNRHASIRLEGFCSRVRQDRHPQSEDPLPASAPPLRPARVVRHSRLGPLDVPPGSSGCRPYAQRRGGRGHRAEPSDRHEISTARFAEHRKRDYSCCRRFSLVLTNLPWFYGLLATRTPPLDADRPLAAGSRACWPAATRFRDLALNCCHAFLPGEEGAGGWCCGRPVVGDNRFLARSYCALHRAIFRVALRRRA